MEWVCASCECENGGGEDSCEACGEERPAAAPGGDGGGGGGVVSESIIVALIMDLAPVPGKDKLRVATLNVGRGEPVAVVSSAPNLSVGARCVVALPGATVTVEGEEVVVKAAAVGGVRSGGMLCDAPMLKWAGGGSGNAALVPDSFAPGDAPPAARPRLK
jgi:tRNA-binding EMAP/Myf-like protein